MSYYRILFMLMLCSILSTTYSFQWFISKNSYGPISDGMKIKDVEKLLNKKLYNHNPYSNSTEDECSYYSDTRNNKSQINFMIENKIIVRIEISQMNISTEQGIFVGSTQEDLRKTYGNSLEWGRNKYDDLPVAYLWSDKKLHKGIKFEIDYIGKISTITVGRSLLLLEGCN